MDASERHPYRPSGYTFDESALSGRRCRREKNATAPQPLAENRPVGLSAAKSVVAPKRKPTMKLTSFNITAGALLGLSLIIGSRTLLISGQGSANPPSTSTSGNFSKRSIHGVWQTVVRQKDCQTGNPGPGVGLGLITFAEGGTLGGTFASAPGSSPPPVSLGISPGHGVWERHNWNDYTVTMITQRLSPDGTFAAWHKVKMSLQLAESGNEFTGTSTFEIVSSSGAVILSGCSTIAGTRIE